MPVRKLLGRPRETDLRAVLDAILYIARSGCQWRILPKDFPPFTTVQDIFMNAAIPASSSGLILSFCFAPSDFPGLRLGGVHGEPAAARGQSQSLRGRPPWGVTARQCSWYAGVGRFQNRESASDVPSLSPCGIFPLRLKQGGVYVLDMFALSAYPAPVLRWRQGGP